MKIILSLLVSLWLSQMDAQSLELQTISAGGDQLTNSSTGQNMNIVLGELSAQTLSINGQIITQGFNQVFNFSTPVVDESYSDFTINVFPNPTADIIHVKGDLENGQYNISIRSIHGQMILSMPYDGNQLSLSIDQIPPGQYILSINDDKGKIVDHLPFIKIN